MYRTYSIEASDKIEYDEKGKPIYSERTKNIIFLYDKYISYLKSKNYAPQVYEKLKDEFIMTKINHPDSKIRIIRPTDYMIRLSGDNNVYAVIENYVTDIGLLSLVIVLARGELSELKGERMEISNYPYEMYIASLPRFIRKSNEIEFNIREHKFLVKKHPGGFITRKVI